MVPVMGKGPDAQGDLYSLVKDVQKMQTVEDCQTQSHVVAKAHSVTPLVLPCFPAAALRIWEGLASESARPVPSVASPRSTHRLLEPSFRADDQDSHFASLVKPHPLVELLVQKTRLCLAQLDGHSRSKS